MALRLLQRRQKLKVCDHCEKALTEVVIKLRANGYSRLGPLSGGLRWKFCSEDCRDLWKAEMMDKRWDHRSRK